MPELMVENSRFSRSRRSSSSFSSSTLKKTPSDGGRAGMSDGGRVRRKRRSRIPVRQPTGLYVHSSPPTVVPVHPSIVRQWLRGGEISRLQEIVLQGQGASLVGEYSPDSKARAFINALPRILKKILELHEAARAGKVEQVEAVVKSESKINLELSRDNAGTGILHKAVIHGHVPLQEWLLKNYPKTVEVLDKEKRNPLHYAGGNEEVWNRLVAGGADTSTVDREGNSPAFYMNHPRRLRPPAPESRSKVPLQGNTGLVVKPSTIRIWIHDKDLGRLQKVLWEGLGDKLKTETSSQPIVRRFLNAVPYILGSIRDVHTAAVNNDPELLLSKSSDPVPKDILFSKDANGLNPLHKAAGLGNMEVARAIIERAPEAVNAKDHLDRTPLHYAAALKDQNQMYQLLVDSNATDHLEDKRGNTPSHYRAKPSELDGPKLLSLIPDAPRTAHIFPPSWDWRLLTGETTTETPMASPQVEAPPPIPDVKGSEEPEKEVEGAASPVVEKPPEIEPSPEDEKGDEPSPEDEKGDEPSETPEEPPGISDDEGVGSEANPSVENTSTPLSDTVNEEVEFSGARLGETMTLTSSLYRSETPKIDDSGNGVDSGNEEGDGSDGKMVSGENGEIDPSDSVLSVEEPSSKAAVDEAGGEEEPGENVKDAEESTGNTKDGLANEDQLKPSRPSTAADSSLKDTENIVTEESVETREETGKNEEQPEGNESLSEGQILTDGEPADTNDDTISQQVGSEGAKDDESKGVEKEDEVDATENNNTLENADDLNSTFTIMPKTRSAGSSHHQNLAETSEMLTEQESKDEGIPTPDEAIASSAQDSELEKTAEENESKVNVEEQEVQNGSSEKSVEPSIEDNDQIADAQNPLEAQNEMNQTMVSNNMPSGKANKIKTPQRIDSRGDVREEGEPQREASPKEEPGHSLKEFSEAGDFENQGSGAVEDSGENSTEITDEGIALQDSSNPTEDDIGHHTEEEDLSGNNPERQEDSSVEPTENDVGPQEDASTNAEDVETNRGSEDPEVSTETEKDQTGNETDATDGQEQNQPVTLRSAGGSRAEVLAITPAPPSDGETPEADDQKAVEEKTESDRAIAEQLVAAGDMESMAEMVLNGKGAALLNMSSTNADVQLFINNIPQYIAKIERVHAAAREGDLRGVQTALDRRKFAVARDNNTPLKPTPLHVAALFGRTSVLRYLAGRFPESMHAQDAGGRTALHYAATLPDNGHFYSLLVTLGADKNVIDNEGRTSEYYIRNKGELTRDELLNEYQNRPVPIDTTGLNFNRFSDKGAEIIKGGYPIFNPEEGQYLANSLGEPLIKGLTEVAHVRPKNPVVHLANFLLVYNKADEGGTNNNRIPSAKRAVTAGKTASTETMEYEPENQPNPNEENQEETLEETFDENGDKEELEDREDEEENADDDNASVSEDPSDPVDPAFKPTNRDEHGQTILHFAAARSHGRNAIYQLLQEMDVNVGLRDGLYRTARDISEQMEITENVQGIDKFVCSIAARGENDKLTELLLEGYDHILDAEDGNSILDIAKERENVETVELLSGITAFEERREKLIRAIRFGSLRQVTELFREAPNKRHLAVAKNNQGRCSLHVAVLSQQENVVEYIAKRFPSTLHIGDNLMRTPLHYAMGVEKVEPLSRILIAAGAERVVKDLKGRQPSYYFMNKTDVQKLQDEEEALRV